MKGDISSSNSSLSLTDDEIVDFSGQDLRRMSDIRDSRPKDSIKMLKLNNNRIVSIDIKEMPKYSNLKYFGISKNQLTKIQGLTSIKNLKILDISENQIPKLDELEKNLELKRIIAFKNSIRGIFLSTPLPNLILLDIRFNPMNNINFAHKMPKLKKLLMDSCQLTNISALNDFRSLEYFSAKKNKINKIALLKNDTLSQIELNGNKLTTITSIDSPLLTYLSISSNPITEKGITLKDPCTSLHILIASATSISNISPICKSYPNLGKIDLTNSQVNNLDDVIEFVKTIKTLKILDLRFTPLTSSLYSKNDAEQVYDSINLYNDTHPDKADQRNDYRLNILRNSISKIEILDNIKIDGEFSPPMRNSELNSPSIPEEETEVEPKEESQSTASISDIKEPIQIVKEVIYEEEEEEEDIEETSANASKLEDSPLFSEDSTDSGFPHNYQANQQRQYTDIHCQTDEIRIKKLEQIEQLDRENQELQSRITFLKQKQHDQVTNFNDERDLNNNSPYVSENKNMHTSRIHENINEEHQPSNTEQPMIDTNSRSDDYINELIHNYRDFQLSSPSNRQYGNVLVLLELLLSENRELRKEANRLKINHFENHESTHLTSNHGEKSNHSMHKRNTSHNSKISKSSHHSPKKVSDTIHRSVPCSPNKPNVHNQESQKRTHNSKVHSRRHYEKALLMASRQFNTASEPVILSNNTDEYRYICNWVSNNQQIGFNPTKIIKFTNFDELHNLEKQSHKINLLMHESDSNVGVTSFLTSPFKEFFVCAADFSHQKRIEDGKSLSKPYLIKLQKNGFKSVAYQNNGVDIIHFIDTSAMIQLYQIEC